MRAGLAGEVEIRVSRDRHSALIAGYVRSSISIDELRASVLAAGAAHQQLTVGETGDISASDARDRVVSRDLRRAELLSVPVTLFVLLFAFGAVVAALVPVLLALTAVAAAFGLLGPISQAFPLDDSVKTVVLLIGMAVGVDYALFYVIRSREERYRGLPSHEALERTARTSGRTVLVSGTTVAIAMAGMYVIGSDIFNGIASGTIAVIACAVAGSVTVLPAVLELLGARIDRGRIPFLPHLRTETADSRFWPAVIDRVQRRPVLSCALSAGLLAGLALPALELHVAKPSNESLSARSEPALSTLVRVQAEFPSTAAPAIVVVTGPHEQQAAGQRAVRQLELLAVARGIAHPPFTLNGSADGRAASIDLPLTGAGDNAASRQAIAILRRRAAPEDHNNTQVNALSAATVPNVAPRRPPKFTTEAIDDDSRRLVPTLTGRRPSPPRPLSSPTRNETSARRAFTCTRNRSRLSRSSSSSRLGVRTLRADQPPPFRAHGLLRDLAGAAADDPSSERCTSSRGARDGDRLHARVLTREAVLVSLRAAQEAVLPDPVGDRLTDRVCEQHASDRRTPPSRISPDLIEAVDSGEAEAVPGSRGAPVELEEPQA
jgi:hypothetical protein